MPAKSGNQARFSLKDLERTVIIKRALEDRLFEKREVKLEAAADTVATAARNSGSTRA